MAYSLWLEGAPECANAALILPPANDFQPSAIFAAISREPPQNPEPTAARGKS